MLGLWVHCQNSIWVCTLDRIVSSSNKSNRLPSKAHLLLPIDMQWKIGIQKERFTDRELRKPFVLYVEHRDMLTAILPTPPQTNKNFEHENQSPLPSILNAMVECRQLKKFGCNGKIFYREWKKIIPPILQDWTASIVQSCQCQRLKCMPRKTFLNVCVCLYKLIACNIITRLPSWLENTDKDMWKKHHINNNNNKMKPKAQFCHLSHFTSLSVLCLGCVFFR